jgi:hypothetical protein
VERRGGKVERLLEVRAMYEPSRIQGDCLVDAYEHAVPIVRRALRGIVVRPEALQAVAVRRAGGAGA